MSSEIETKAREGESIPAADARRAGAPFWHIHNVEQYDALYRESINDPESFYRRETSELSWFQTWTEVCSGTAPNYRWFEGAQTNLCHNVVDRHVENGFGSEVALVWESESVDPSGNPIVRKVTYSELQEMSARFANVLKKFGIQKGDIVTVYMGMVPESVAVLLGCLRIGAVHSVIFGGFSSQAIADRIEDAKSKIVVCCDGLYRRGKVVKLKSNVDDAIKILEKRGQGDIVKSVIVYNRCNLTDSLNANREYDFQTLMSEVSSDCAVESLEGEAMSFLLYTSGSTGKPKGIVHTTAGYMVQTYLSAKYVFNLIPEHNQLFWCTADIGWITGHSYVLYGIMANRIPTLMYEGAPDFPDVDRFWKIIERHKVTHFYTAPTAVRAFMKWGKQYPEQHDLSSLQVLGSVGEPINPAAWNWYYENIGEKRCPIVDTYWQTETGAHMLTPLPGLHELKPGSCMYPFFGVDARIVDRQGKAVEEGSGSGGLLAIAKPWPSMLRGIYGDEKRFLDTYWSTVEIDGSAAYFAGDGAYQDADGAFWVMGRVDDVINVSGHRLGTMELESALVAHEAVVEAAVVGFEHDLKGTAIAAFVTLHEQYTPSNEQHEEELKEKLRRHITDLIGAIAKPDSVRFVEALPKTRSGKIMRRLLRDIANGKKDSIQDISTLEDESLLSRLKEQDE